ncbi:hypothetical protein K457DRAFT_86911 [Linnemannia elongata AG-77]|uniref:Fe2OG dioxygenase domain-containing protein n=1 Tax=Linnemannia elongata AG-77 TaxID=1314771 RepID=A0A197KEP3_9FUNG|nr:hypothetical protein K457DRAFT_86911 [Linnemannia elongata AG-77]
MEISPPSTFDNATLQGLQVIRDFVSVEEEAQLIQQLDERNWAGRGIEPNPEMKRRHQHYGGTFSYRLRRVVGKMERLPSMFDFVTDRLLDRQIYKTSPNSIIVNEYEAGQGIMPHVDAPKLFGPTITALSLLSDCVMTFQHVKEPSLIFRVHLPCRSLVVMNESCRYDYKHSISKDLVETVDGIEIIRARRVSITYRDMLVEEQVHEGQEQCQTPSRCGAQASVSPSTCSSVSTCNNTNNMSSSNGTCP